MLVSTHWLSLCFLSTVSLLKRSKSFVKSSIKKNNIFRTIDVQQGIIFIDKTLKKVILIIINKMIDSNN